MVLHRIDLLKNFRSFLIIKGQDTTSEQVCLETGGKNVIIIILAKQVLRGASTVNNQILKNEIAIFKNQFRNEKMLNLTIIIRSLVCLSIQTTSESVSPSFFIHV